MQKITRRSFLGLPLIGTIFNPQYPVEGLNLYKPSTDFRINYKYKHITFVLQDDEGKDLEPVTFTVSQIWRLLTAWRSLV